MNTIVKITAATALIANAINRFKATLTFFGSEAPKPGQSWFSPFWLVNGPPRTQTNRTFQDLRPGGLVPTNPPEGFHTPNPVTMAKDPDRLIGFIEETLTEQSERRFNQPDGRVAHAEVRIGDSVLMVGGADDQYPSFPAMISVYVDNVDAVYAAALAASATSLRAPIDQFFLEIDPPPFSTSKATSGRCRPGSKI